MILVFVAAGLLVLWNARNQNSFARDYAYQGSFAGTRYECIVGGLYSDDRVLCMAGADRAGIYFLPHPKRQRLFRNSGYSIFKKSLLIPWQDMSYCSKKVLFKDCIWFDLSPRKIWIYVPREVGEKLLTDAHREIPS
jgi:hypothetical protein